MRWIVSRQISGANLRWTCAQKKTYQRVPSGRTTYRVILHPAQMNDKAFDSTCAPGHCRREATRLHRYLRDPALFTVVPPQDTIGLSVPLPRRCAGNRVLQTRVRHPFSCRRPSSLETTRQGSLTSP